MRLVVEPGEQKTGEKTSRLDSRDDVSGLVLVSKGPTTWLVRIFTQKISKMTIVSSSSVSDVWRDFENQQTEMSGLTSPNY